MRIRSRATRHRTLTFLAAGALAAGLSGCGGPKGPDPSNQLPFGYLDAPAPNVQVPRKLRAAGWAMDDGGIARIDIYVNGKFSVSTTPVVPRPDVGKAFPQFARDGNVYGWEADVDLGEAPGPRQILAQAVDTAGATRDLGVSTVTVVGK